MKINKIGIIGQGFVGKAVKEGLKNYYEILTFDKDKRKSGEKSLEDLIGMCRIIFVCLPTPMESSGKCHIDILESVISEIDDICDKTDYYGNAQRTAIIKSTIPPGTTEVFCKKYKHVSIAYNPEFLTEVNSIDDFKNQNKIIIGSTRKVGSVVKNVYSKVFPKVPIIKTSATIAEMVKYFTNTFLATKVSFANEMYKICDVLDIDYDKVVEYAKHDDRIGYSHLNVPGPDGDLGFGGHCFPKDLNALIHLSDKLGLGLDINVLKAVRETNYKVRQNRDWEKLEGRAVIGSKNEKIK